LVAQGDRIWFHNNSNISQGNDNGIFSLKDGEMELHLGDLDEVVKSIQVIDENNILIWTRFYVYTYNGTEIVNTIDLELHEILGYSISIVFIDSQKNMWFSYWKSASVSNDPFLIRKFDGTDWTTYELDHNVNRIVEDSTGKIWCEYDSDDADVYAYAYIENDVIHKITLQSIQSIPFRFGTPRLLKVSSNNKLWVTGSSSPNDPLVYSYDFNELIAYDTSIDNLENSIYTDLITTCEGDILAGSYSKIEIFKNGEWNVFMENNGDFSGGIHDINVHPITCELYFAVNGDTQCLYKFDGSAIVPVPNPFGSTCIIDIYFDDIGNLYASGWLTGWGVYNGAQWDYVYTGPPSGVIDDSVNGTVVDKFGVPWISTDEDGLCKYENGNMICYNAQNSILENKYYLLYKDKNDNIWAHSGNKLYKFDGTEWTLNVLPFPDMSISSIYHIKDNEFWLATYRNGLFYWNGIDLINYNVHNSDISSDRILEIASDKNGSLWMIDNFGVSRLTCLARSKNEIVRGKVYFDANLNGAYEEEIDQPLAAQKVRIQPENVLSYSNINGDYSFVPINGSSHEIEVETSSGFEATSPNPFIGPINIEQNQSANMGFWADQLPLNFELDLGHTPMICNFPVSTWITLENQSSQISEGTLFLNSSHEITYLDAIPSYQTESNDGIEWIVTDLQPFERRVFRLDLVGPAEEFFDEQVILKTCFQTDTQENCSESEEALLCSYDPNDKRASSTGPSIDEYSLLKDELEYTIRFQNMGNYRAAKVIILDTLDENLNVESFEIISSSHTVDVTLHEGVVEFLFEDIFLPPIEQDSLLSQGFVKYRIAPNADILDNTLIENTAYIYFDFNNAIVTNTTKNILVEELPTISSTSDLVQTIKVYPNPTNGNIYLELDQAELIDIKIYNLLGNLVYQKNQSSKEEIDISQLVDGTYVVNFQMNNKFFVSKFVKI
jgi:uncharacterized repeat protein (TIGR01451 family)